MQKCTICIHSQREEIDEALLLSATPLRTIADQFGISKTALLRHKTDHIPTDLVKAKDAKEVCRAESLLDKLVSLKSDAERIAKKAESNDDLKTALSGIREQSHLTVNNFTLLKIHDRLSRKLEGNIEVNG
jgi:hypothetical protein